MAAPAAGGRREGGLKHLSAAVVHALQMRSYSRPMLGERGRDVAHARDSITLFLVLWRHFRDGSVRRACRERGARCKPGDRLAMDEILPARDLLYRPGPSFVLQRLDR